ncbi:MAG: hypothetical protein AMS18_06610 [Gemmatimonas sp. SG8_17]|nr:MAG: hypothetical protein AMS18_06610 [Gemmatimonas sp. SG8_17]
MHSVRSVVPAVLVGCTLLFASQVLSGQQVAEVQVAPVTVTLAVGERKELLASAYDSRGDNIATARFAWTSSSPGVVRVEEDPSVPGIAILFGVGPGLANVEVRVGNRRASAAVQVVSVGAGPAALGGTGLATVLQIEPGSVFLLPSEDVRLQARFLKDDGSLAAPAMITWRSLRPDIATVTPDGVAVGVSLGQGVIEATSATGLLARVTVQVAQAPFGFGTAVLSLSPAEADSLSVVVPSQNNRMVSARRLVWRSTNDAVVRVSPIGVATGVSAGSAEIVATGFGQESRLRVSVHRPVEFLEVQPTATEGFVALPLGGSITFSATPLASDETAVPEAPLTWVQPDTALAAFDPTSGRLTGKALGETQLQVRGPGEGLEVTWAIHVIVGGLAIDPGAVALSRGARRDLTAFFTDDVGVPVSPASELTWTSSDAGIVAVDGQGGLEAKSFGVANVVATTVWGGADTAAVYVQGEILVTSTRGGQADVFAFDREHPDQFNQVTDQPGNELNAVYSPDGTKIVYVSDEGGGLDLFLVDAVGGNPVRLTSTQSLEASPCWTPDGSKIVYESDATGVTQIWIMNADGSEVRQLTQGEVTNIQPAVSPDGRTIAFTSVREGNYDIYVMDLDGSNQRSFTAAAVNETMPVWVSDSAIAYVSERYERRRPKRTVTVLDSSGQLIALTPEELVVTDFAISPAGDLLAAVVSADGRSGLESRLYLIPLTGEGTPVEVPRAGPKDQLGAPAFRP